MSFFFLIILGLSPSILWLLYFLRKDVHPEPKLMVLKIFFWGALITLPAFFIERGLFEVLTIFKIPQIFYIFLGIAGVEEILKFLVVKEKVISDPEFDEPLDAPLYMIISALGFAGVENILYLFSASNLTEIFTINLFRFVGAVFLHALCSGSWGYFLALSFLKSRQKIKFFSAGLLTAIGAHGLFNFSLKNLEKSIMVIQNIETQEITISILNFHLFVSSFVTIFVILLGLLVFLLQGFKKLKQLKSICQPEIALTKTENQNKIK